MLKSVVAVVLLLATNAFAFRGRPVSDVQFDRHIGVSRDRIASDFNDFVLLTGNGHPALGVFTQKVVDGEPAGPHRLLGSGSPEELAWMGTEYLAAWTDKKALRTGTVSRDGTPLALVADPVISGDRTFLGVNGTRVLAFAYTGNKLKVQPLDPQGRPTGIAQTYTAPTSFSSVATGRAANGAIGVAFSGFNGTWLMLFRADGSTITNAPIVLDGPYGGTTIDRHSNTAAIATNGRDTAVVFGTELFNSTPELKTAIVGADGTVKDVRVTHTNAITQSVIAPASLVWDGTQFLALLNVARPVENSDAALLRIASDGTRVGDFVWITQESGWQIATALGWTGHDLLVPMYDSRTWPDYPAFCVAVNAATLTPGPRANLARTLTTQQKLTIEAGTDGYLAAWFEYSDTRVKVRASRIDAAGNYLDGAGIVLSDKPLPVGVDDHTIAIEGKGPQWLVVWTGHGVNARTMSRNGIAGAPIMIHDRGRKAAVRWDGTQYVVLSSDESLFRSTLSASGVAGETVMLAESHESFDHDTFYEQPALVQLGAKMLAVYSTLDGSCDGPNCSFTRTVTGLMVDEPGATPFAILDDGFDESEFAVASSPSQALVLSTGQGLRGVFLDSAGNFGAPFTLHAFASSPALAFDGTDFVGSWSQSGKLHIARIRAGGALLDPRALDVSAIDTDIAASDVLPPLAGFIAKTAATDDVLRAGVVLAEDGVAAAVPAQPVIGCATRNEDDTITVRWQHAGDALGIAIELELADGTFREIGVAPEDATIATVSTAGLPGSAVRVRAWNAAGLSAPSALASSLPAPDAVVPSSVAACAGVEFVLTATLRGAAPFTVRWSDGVVQSGINAYTVSRKLTLDANATLSIVSITDASCLAGSASATTHIAVSAAPRIDDQTRVVQVARGQAASLSVTSPTAGVKFQWFAGARGDTSHPVGGNASSYTTPAANETLHYWVRLSTSCGVLDSAPMDVVLNGRRRAVR